LGQSVSLRELHPNVLSGRVQIELLPRFAQYKISASNVPLPCPTRPPLQIEYSVSEEGVVVGWSVKGRGYIQPSLPMYDAKSMDLVRQWDKEGTLHQLVHQRTMQIFHGALSAGMNIPPNYPYQFFRQGQEEVLYEGKLKETK